MWRESAQSKAAAVDGLKILKQLSERTRGRELGLESSREVEGAVLGEPIPIFSIAIDDLKSYTGESNPLSMIEFTNTVVYPVKIGTSVKSSVTIKDVNGKWRSTSYGFPAFARLLGSALQKETTALSGPKTQPFFLVHVPVLESYFLGSLPSSYSEGGLTDFTVRSLGSDRNLPEGLSEGAESARKVFSILAAKIKSLPNAPS